MTREILEVKDNGLPIAEPSLEEKQEQLNKILRSRVFQGSGIVMTLLEYLVRHSFENPEAQVKEYTIAIDVFGRGSEFNPNTNSIVRVQARRLRVKLQEYYENEGKSDRVLIELPKGHYRVTYSYVEPKEESDEAEQSQPDSVTLQPAAQPETAREPRKDKVDFTKAALLVMVIILSAAVILLALPYAGSNKQAQTATVSGVGADYELVWSPFLKTNDKTLLVLSNPAVYRFLNNSDAEVAAKNSLQITPEHAQMLAEVLNDTLVMRQGRAPRLVLTTTTYTGIGEAIGLYHLTDLFRSQGKEVTLKQSRTVSAEDLKNRNVILLGSVWVNDWVEKLPVKEDFTYTVNASIENKAPLAGEEREYKPRYNSQTGTAEVDYAIITVKPGVTKEHRLMILSGLLSEGTQAAAECVTRKDCLYELDRRLEQASDEDGPPKYYQALLKVDVDNGIPTTVTIVAVHPLRVTRD
ncbi:MAG TPA: hypothetical protein VKA70_17295 [Blastocatellia bacterium]|nr:hypothetical protein [Blastocatellia bacterium]